MRFYKNWLAPQVMAKLDFSNATVVTETCAAQWLKKEKIWLVSTGGVASNYLYSLLGQPMKSMTYQLLCHYPHPVPVDNKNLKAIFLFDDIYHAIESQFNRGFHIPNIRKISNHNYNRSQLEMNMQEYAQLGKDLFKVEKQFDAWTNPKGNIQYEICCLKTSTLEKHFDELVEWLGIKPAKKCEIRPFKKSTPSGAMKRLYGGLDAKIKNAPEFKIRAPLCQ